jgi:hypothetical protein
MDASRKIPAAKGGTSMNISHLLLRMAGATQPSEVRTLELKAGQTIRAIVLGTAGDGEALLSLDGVQVKALLKGIVQPGQLLHFLVLPESSGGRLVLRPVETQPESGAAAVLRQLGLDDSAENRAQLQLMQREGVPVTRESFLSLKEALASRPAAVPAEAWTETVLAGARKGLPLTRDAALALHRTLSGPPLDRLADALLRHAAAWKQEAAPAKPNEALLQLVTRLEGRLQAITRTMAEAAAAPRAAPEFPAGEAETAAGRTAPPAAGAAAARNTAEEAAPTVRIDAAVPRGAAQSASPVVTGAPGETTARPGAEPPPSGGLRPPVPPADGGQAEIMQSQAPVTSASSRSAAGSRAQSAAVQPEASLDAGQRAAPKASSPAAADMEEGGWLPRLLRFVGVDLEHDWLTRAVMQPPRHTPPPSGPLSGLPAAEPPMPTETAVSSEAGMRTAADSLKSILLQLHAHDELPGPFKETIQQTIQHITGQQLLLSADRNGTFTHLTLFLPMLPGQDGQRPAALHIQSRKKGKQGAVDSDNCRLLFDLCLGFLGSLLIDVQVVDRYVNVTLHHRDPRIREWAAAEKPQFEAALDKMGYRCAQLRCVPLPEQPEAGGIERNAGESAGGGNRLPPAAPQPYKGVDVRI